MTDTGEIENTWYFCAGGKSHSNVTTTTGWPASNQWLKIYCLLSNINDKTVVLDYNTEK